MLLAFGLIRGVPRRIGHGVPFFVNRESAQWLKHKVPTLAETELRGCSGKPETLLDKAAR
jgi:hypothetical protein